MFGSWKYRIDDWLYEHEHTFPINVFLKCRDKYYKVVPYDYRPGNLLYKLKCFLWRRYSTVRCRYLPHTWVDRDMLLLHSSMEILSKFLEQECSPGIVDWDADDDHKNAMEEMRNIYNWWHNDYIPNYYHGKYTDAIYEKIPHPVKSLVMDGPKVYELKYASDEEEELANSMYAEIRDYEELMTEKANCMLKRLVDIRHFMWT